MQQYARINYIINFSTLIILHIHVCVSRLINPIEHGWQVLTGKDLIKRFSPELPVNTCHPCSMGLISLLTHTCICNIINVEKFII